MPIIQKPKIRIQNIHTDEIFPIYNGDGDAMVVTKQEAADVIQELIESSHHKTLKNAMGNLAKEFEGTLNTHFELYVKDRLDQLNTDIDAYLSTRLDSLCAKIFNQIIERRFNEEVERRVTKRLNERSKF